MICYKCNEESESFVKGKKLCKNCDSKRGVKSRFENLCIKHNITFNNNDYLYYKVCSCCNKKFLIKFFKSKNASICCSCAISNIKKSQQQFQKRNPEKRKKIQSEYYIKNRDTILSRQKEYNKTNIGKEKERLRHKKYRDKVGDLRNTPEKKIRHLVSTKIRKAINKNGETMTKYLPYKISELKEHLESQFESWMNWNNWGMYNADDWNDNDPLTWTWQIDHIIPHSKFNYTSMEDGEFLKCWSLKNLRPYSAKKNVLEGVSRKRHGGV